MPRRGRTRTWLRGGAGWCVCFLMAGCLSAHIEPDNMIVLGEPTARASPGPGSGSIPGASDGKADASPPLFVELPPEPQPDPQSNYHLLVKRLQSSIDPKNLELTGFGSNPQEELDKNNKPPTLTAGVAPPPPKKDAPLVAALRLALEKHPRQARALLQQYDKTDRELLQSLLSLTAEVGEGELEKLPPREVERTLEELRELALQLRQRAPLTLGKVCFCREIVNFGQYTPLPADYEFQAGYDNRPGEWVKVYAEVRNFGAALRNGQYETRLNSSLSVYKAGGRKGEWSSEVVKQNSPPEINCSLTPRQDYYIRFDFHVFPKLPPGLYTLWVTVKDVTPGQPGGARVATRSLDFKVCPPGAGPLAQP